LDTFGLDLPAGIHARFNVAPRQMNPVVAPSPDGSPAVTSMSWGLVPFWDKAEKPKIAPINARSEDVLKKPMFSQSLQKRRCAVLADGFYGWETLSGGSKRGHFITMRDRGPFFIAGIFEAGSETRGSTYALLTTRANKVVGAFHDRMPIILTGASASRWVAPGDLDDTSFAPYREPYPAESMQEWAVSSIVNKPANDIPECIVPEAFTLDASSSDPSQNIS
jgi:putative SOS response-associated peptidase YedK